MKQREKWSGNMGRAAGELPRHQGEKQNGSEGKYRYSEIKKTDLSGETEELAEEKGLKHGKNHCFSVLFAVLMAAVPVAVYFIRRNRSDSGMETGNPCGGRCADGRRDILSCEKR